MSKIQFYLNIYQAIRLKAESDPEYFKLKRNQVPIYIDYSFGERLRISTKVFVNPTDWDQEKQRIKGTDTEAGQKNNRLTILKEKLFKIESEAIVNDISLTVEYIKKKLSTSIQVKGNSTSEKYFLQAWGQFVTGNPDMNQNTRRNYDNTLIVLQDYCTKYGTKLTFEGITIDFYQDLRRYFANDRKITNNTVGKYIKNLKAFLNYCTKKGINANLAFNNFEISKDPKEITYLTNEEIRKIMDAKLDSEILQHSRDLFLFSCFSGLRYSDTQKITPANIKDDFIVFTAVKTKQPQVTPITPQARKILIKYKNQLPKIKIHNYNTNIKLIGEKAGITEQVTRIRFVGSERKEDTKPKNEFFSSHLAKRTYVSIFFRSGGRIETIMQTTGNKDRKTMKSYLGIKEDDIKKETLRIFDDLKI
jgi:site-specific recombinase XerD